MNKMDTLGLKIVFEEQQVIIKKVGDQRMDVLVLDYEEFDELAYKIRQTRYGLD